MCMCCMCGTSRFCPRNENCVGLLIVNNVKKVGQTSNANEGRGSFICIACFAIIVTMVIAVTVVPPSPASPTTDDLTSDDDVPPPL